MGQIQSENNWLVHNLGHYCTSDNREGAPRSVPVMQTCGVFSNRITQKFAVSGPLWPVIPKWVPTPGWGPVASRNVTSISAGHFCPKASLLSF